MIATCHKKLGQISFSYQKFWEDEITHRITEPYALKEFKSVGIYLQMIERQESKSFALDRLSEWS
jgi:predicted DNA-binding transcriptional regulator YafY